MPSSTSSSDTPRPDDPEDRKGQDPTVGAGRALMQPGKPGDDPRIGQGPVERPLPQGHLWLAALIALLVLVVGLLGWELHWRSFGATPGYTNSDGQWAIQRRRINQGEGDSTVLIGTSRMLFDVQLDVWERLAGERPIQLALEGTSPMFALEDLAADPDFTGRLLVDVTPDLFFSGYSMRGDVLEYSRRQTPSQRIGERLAMLLEPRLAFLEPDFRLATVLARQAWWPSRPGIRDYIDVRKLAVHEADRNTRMWSKVEQDPEYRELARRVWAQFFDAPPPPSMDTPEKAMALARQQMDRAAAAVALLHARGVPVVFVRPPSSGDYLAHENRILPRERSWDPLLAHVGVPGIHFEDHDDMQGLDLPEWSHLSAADAERYTEALYRVWSALPEIPEPAR